MPGDAADGAAYVPLVEAAEVSNASTEELRKALKRNELRAVRENPANKRSRWLVALEDVESVFGTFDTSRAGAENVPSDSYEIDSTEPSPEPPGVSSEADPRSHDDMPDEPDDDEIAAFVPVNDDEPPTPELSEPDRAREREAALDHQMAQVVDHIARSDEHLVRAEDQLARSAAQIERVEEQYDRAMQQYTLAEDQYSRTAVQLTRAEELMEVLAGSVGQLAEMLANAGSDQSDLLRRMTETLDRAAQAEAMCEELERRVESLEAERSRLTARLESERTEAQRLNIELERTRAELERTDGTTTETTPVQTEGAMWRRRRSFVPRDVVDE